jgi:hypothetical protein
LSMLPLRLVRARPGVSTSRRMSWPLFFRFWWVFLRSVVEGSAFWNDVF